MKRQKTGTLVVIAAILIGCAVFALRLPAEAGEPAPAAAVQAALDAVRSTKSHRFSAEIRQQVSPAGADSASAGQVAVQTIRLDGEVAEPGHARLNLTLDNNGSGQQAQTDVLLIGNDTYIDTQGSWRKVSDPLGTAGPAADAVSLLDAVKDVERLPDADNAAGISRHYGFVIDSARYADLMRMRLEALLSQDAGLDVSIQPQAGYWNIAGSGELWVGEDGLPQRLQLDLTLPEVTAGFDARLQMRVDYRDFGAPIAPIEPPSAAADAAISTGETVASATPGLALLHQIIYPALFVSLLLAAIALGVLVIRRRAGYVAVAIGMTVVFVFTPLLQTGVAARSLDRLAAQENPPQIEGNPESGAPVLDDARLQDALSRLAQPAVVTTDVSDCSNIPGGLPAADDQDQDGMDNLTESCLGTDYNHADSDGDTITDTLELQGFTLNNVTWTTDPKMRDSNLDGMDDAAEWSPNWATLNASTLDPDGDGIPNPWDDDNDGDGVVDSLDNSPFTVLGYKSSYDLKVTKPTAQLHQDTTVYIDLLVQPQDATHLRYATTPLDWPSDDLAQVQDLDNSADDVLLFPMIQFKTTIPPSLSENYGYLVSGPDSNGNYTVMAPVTTVGADGAVDAFKAHMVFTASDSSLGLNLTGMQLGWLVQANTDEKTSTRVFHRIYGNYGYWTTKSTIKTTPEVAVSYYEPQIRIAGLSVTESEGAEVALFGAPSAPETSTTTADEGTVISNLMAGLNTSYLYNLQPDLPTIVDRFANASTPPDEKWGITTPVATSYATYDHREEALATTTMTTTVDFLGQNYSHSRTPMLALGYQETTGAVGLESDAVTLSGSKLTVDLSQNTLSTMRQIEVTQYQWQSSANSWRALSMDEALAELADRYPSQEEQSTKSAVDYLVLHYYAGLVNYVERDGVALVGAQADDQAIFDWLSQPQETSLPGYVQTTWNIDQLESLSTTYGDARGWQVWQDGLDTLGLPGIDSYLTQVSDTRDRLAPKGRSVPDGYSWGLRVSQGSLQDVTRSQPAIADALQNGAAVWHAANQSNAAASVGVVVKPTNTWLMFSNSEVNLQAMQLALDGGYQAAVTVTTVIAILILGPVLAVDALLYAFGIGSSPQSILDDIAEWLAGTISDFSMYSELDSNNPLTSSSTTLSLGNPDEGIVTGNSVVLQTDFTSTIVKGPGKSKWNWTHSRSGNLDDVKDSSAYGEWRFSGAAGATVTPNVPTPTHYNCTTSNNQGHCKSHATVSITPEQAVRNLAIKITTVVNYSLRYQSCYGVNFIYDYCEAKTVSGVAPSSGDTTSYNNATTTLYIDVFPNTVSGLWEWSDLKNWDLDGDLLCNGAHNTSHPSACIGWESATCPNGVLPANATSTCVNVWDSDGDGLSDGYEKQLGSNGLRADSDNDGLTDSQELLIGTSPTRSDYDGDGLKDGEEVCTINADGQQVGGWEVTTVGSGPGRGYWVCSSPTDADYDNDGLNDKAERAIGTSPVAANTAPRLTQTVIAPSYEDPNSPGAAPLTILGPGDAIQEQFHLFNDIADALDTMLQWCAPSGTFGALSVTGVTASSGYSVPTPATATVGSDDCTLWDLSQSPLYPGEEFTVTLQAPSLASAASGSVDQTLTLPFTDPTDPSVTRQAQATAQVIIDNTPPVAVINDPPADDTTVTNAASYLVTGSASDTPSDSWVASVEVSIAGGAWQPVNGTGVFTWTWTLPLTDGSYALQTRATDVVGNVQTTPSSATVVVDRTGPSASITNLADGQVITNLTPDSQGGATIPVEIEASDLASGASVAAGVDVIQVSIDGGPWEHIWSARSDAPPTQAETYSWKVYAGASGSHAISARAIDALGQAGDATTVRVVLDILPPAVTLGNYLSDLPAGQSTTLLGHADDTGNAPLPARPADLSGSLDSQDDATVWLEASNVGDLTGGTVTWVGDMNGDNRADAAIGMPAANAGEGKVVILYGRAGDWPVPPDVEALDASISSMVVSGSSSLGSHIAPAGDVNGDGLSDLLIGDSGNNRVYVVYGRYDGTGASWDLSTLSSSSSSTKGVILTSQGGTIGQWIAAAGDVNDDRYGDLLIGTSSSVYLLAGRSKFASQTFAIDSQSAAVIPFAAASGSVATGVGDLNDDGLADFAVSDPANSYGAGARVYLLLGSSNYKGAASIPVVPVNDAAASFSGSSQPGKQVVALGDIDGDGLDDLLYSDGNAPRLVYGRSAADWGQGYGGDATLSYSPAASGVLAAAGDVNADGLNDLLLGTSTNQAYVIHGSAARPGSPAIAATIDNAAAVASAPYAAGSDLNCDLSSDLLIVPPDAGGGQETPAEIAHGPVPQPDPAGLPVSAQVQGPGAISRQPLRAQQASDTVYVSPTYCASCDNDGHGWGTDAFATIQSAIDAGGQTIFVLPGIYEEQISLADGVNIVGSGPEVTILAPPTSATGQSASRAPASDLAESSLVGYWTFDGTLADDTGNGNNGTYSGHGSGATYSTNVPATLGSGQSIDFQGGEAIMVKHSDSLLFDQAFTVAYWVEGTAAEMSGKTMGKPGNPNAGELKWEVQDANGSGNRNRMATYNSPGWDYGPEYDPSDNGWQHVAYVVRIQGGVRYQDLYLNGAYVSTVGGNRATTSLGNTTPLWFGSGGDGGFTNPSYGISGMLDDVALWNEALSAEDIASLASGVKSPADWINRPMVSAGMAGSARLAHMTIQGNDSYDGVRVKQGNVTLQRLVIRNTNTAVTSDGNRAAVTLLNNTVVNNVDGVHTRNCGSLDQRNTVLAFNQGTAIDLTSCGATAPVAAWSFDEGSGVTAFDDTGNGNNGTLVNGAAYATSAAPIGTENPYALTLDGVDDHVVIPDADALDFGAHDDFTVSVWAKPDATQYPSGSDNDSDLVEKWSQHEARFPYVIRYFNQNAGSDEGKVAVARYDGSNNPYLHSTTAINNGQWHHIVMVRSGGASGTLKLYVDGVLEGSIADTTTGTTVNDSDLFIGQRGDNINRFHGLVDDLQIYDQALSDVAVRSLTNAGRTGGSVTRDYDLFWRNGEDLTIDGAPVDQPAPGDVFADPLFVQSSINNFQLLDPSPAINAGDPDDPTPPATGGRVDIGAWQHAQAAFYADDDYCETCINDGLDWQVDAFNVVQDAIDSAATTMAQAFSQGTKSTYTIGVGPGTYSESLTLPSYTRLAGSGADDTTIQGPGSGSTVVLSGTVQSEISGLKITGSGSAAGNAAILATGHSNTITVTRSLITGNGDGILFEDGSSGVTFNNTIANNARTAVAASGAGSWAGVHNSILAGNASGLCTAGGAIFNDYNLLYDNAENYSAASTSDGLQGYWRFDEGGGSTATDWSGNGYNASLPGGAVYTSDAAPLSFDNPFAIDLSNAGAAQAGNTTLINNAQMLTLALWAKADSVPATGYARFITLDGEKAVLRFDGGRFDFYMKINGTIQHIHAGVPAVGEWYHVAGTYDGTTMRLYVDGVEIGSRTVSGTVGAGLDVQINSNNERFDGLLDDVRVYDRALSPCEIALLAAGDTADGTPQAVVQRSHEITGQDPLFVNAGAGDYSLQAASPAVDTGEPLAPVPVGGGSISDMGYREVLAVPLTLLFGAEGTTCVEGNSGMASVEVGISHVIDASQPVTATEPSSWSAATLATAGETGSYWNAAVTPSEGDGLYRLYSQGDDVAGNDSGPQFVSAFVADGTAPAVTWTWPVAASVSTNFVAFELEAQVSDYVPTGAGQRFNVSSVSFEVNGVPVDADWVDDGWSADSGLARSFSAVVGGVSGTLEVVAIARDRSGNETRSETRTVTVVDNGDSAVITSPALAGDTNNPVIPLTGYARFASPGVNPQVTLSVLGQTTTVQAQLADSSAAITAWSATVTLPGEGVYEIVATATSGAGQHSPDGDVEDHVFVKVTSTPPQLTVTSPADGAIAYDTVDIAGSVTTGATGLSALEISLDGGFTWQALPVANDGSWSTQWLVPADQDFVGYEIRIRASDLAGNVAEVSRRIFADNQGPTSFTPVTLDPEPGSHVQVGTTLQTSWQPPTDGSGSSEMLVAISAFTDTIPSTVASGNAWSAALDTTGDWYFHLMAEDLAGNQTHKYYGPYHVEGSTSVAAGADGNSGGWTQSVVVDGFIDLDDGEWNPATEELDVDPRWGQPQVLYTTWDSSNLFLGRQGSLWGADGVGWFYFDTSQGGTIKSVHWPTLTLPMQADYAIEIISRDDRTLWRFDGASWQAMPGDSFEFDHGASGDTEIRVPLTAIGQPDSLAMLAFAASTRTGEIWGVFPTTNPLASCALNGPCPDWHHVYHWDSLGQNVVPNEGQPRGHHASVTLTSPQGSLTGWGPGETLQFVARVKNLDNDPLTPAGLILDGSAGLAFDSVTSGLEFAPENDRWFVNLGDLEPGDSRTVTLTTHLLPDLTGLEFVTVTGQVVLPLPASEPSLATTSFSHRVDSQPPTVQIDLPAAALAPGAQTVHGTAHDGDGGGVARVEVQVNGGGWTTAQGTTAWQASIDVPGSGTFALAARAIDVHGYTSDPVTLQVLVDSEPPSVSLDLPNPVLSGTVAHLSGHAADAGSGVALVQLRIDNGPWFVITLPFEPAGEDQVIWHYNWTLPAEDGVEHAVSVRARDAAGNQGAAIEPTTVTVDSIAPVSVIASPEPSAVVSPPDLLIWGVASDGLGLSTVEVSLDGAQTWQPAELVMAATMDDDTLRKPLPDDTVLWNLMVPVSSGQNLIIYARATDLAGNVQRLGAPVRVTVAADAERRIWMPLVNRYD